VVEDGVEALQFLNQEAAYVDAPRPDIILLDLNLPRMSWREVPEAIKNADTLKLIPVVILTTSDNERDIVASYALHANCYITKPVDMKQFVTIVQNVKDF
jgi:two-component system, chemotaxis family, response regulator Rcp1